MNLQEGRVDAMVQNAVSDPFGSIICHDTIHAPHQSVCRGFFDRHKTPVLSMAESMNAIEFTDPQESPDDD